MKRNKHIWEGWTVGDFIDELEPFFELAIRSNQIKSKKDVKQWCIDNQPYYKKHIPEVYDYFLKKAKF